MVSRVTLAASLAAGLVCQMKATAQGTIAGERSVLVVDPLSPDPNAAYPLVTQTDRGRLLKANLAEDYDGEVPSAADQQKVAQAALDADYEARRKAFDDGRPVQAPPTRFVVATITTGTEGDTVDRAAANKTAEEEALSADQEVPVTTGLGTRQTTHYAGDGPNEGGLTGDQLALAGAGIAGAEVLSKPELEEVEQAEQEAEQATSVSADDPDAAPATGRRRSSK